MKTDMAEIGTGTGKGSVKENERKREKNRFEELFCKVEGIKFCLMTKFTISKALTLICQFTSSWLPTVMLSGLLRPKCKRFVVRG